MQNYVVTDYLLSRQVVEELQRRIDVRSLYDSDLARNDPWARFAKNLPMERFVGYWKRMVSANYDPMTGLAVVTVRAFSPEDALSIANTMVTLAEDLVNSVAKRPQMDSVRFAEGEVRRTEERFRAAREAMTDYRLKEGMIDPAGALSSNLTLVQTLRSQLMQQQGDLASLMSQQQNPNSPAAQSLRSRIAATKDQLSKLEKEVSKDREGNKVLTELVGRYERLDLERQYAQAGFVAAQQALDQARANAAAQHLYLTPYVRPVLAESSTYPKRAQSTLIAALAFFGIWIVGLMFVRAVSEHV
jgi:capsular polysaccharide transport system permease protein